MRRISRNLPWAIVLLGLFSGQAWGQSAPLVLHSVAIHQECGEFRAVYSSSYQGYIDIVDDGGNILNRTLKSDGKVQINEIFRSSGDYVTATDTLSRISDLTATYPGNLYLQARDNPSIRSNGVPVTQAPFCEVTLHNLTVDNCLQTFTAKYTKTFVTCGHIKETSTNVRVHARNSFCDLGDNVERTVPLSDMDKLGDPPYELLYMVHGNVASIRSESVLPSEVPSNLPPTANAGTDFTAHPTDTVTLDGSASSHPCGDQVTYSWQFISKPAASNAVLMHDDTPNPSFVMDEIGEYEFELIVTDSKGLSSAPDTVTVSSVNTAPVASASAVPAELVLLNTLVQLDGTGSYDEDGDPITYNWLLTPPLGSLAQLDDSKLPDPVFTADVQGEYQAALVVVDALGSVSEPATVTLSFENRPPMADPGPQQSVVVGDTVSLNGGGSSDANGDSLSYQWSFASVPLGSLAEFSDSTTVRTEFFADEAGEYVVSLVVSDGQASSAPGTVGVTAVSVPDRITQSIQDALSRINKMGPEDFSVEALQRVLGRRLNVAVTLVERGRYRAARGVLEALVLNKLDGCAERGAPDTGGGFFRRPDWLVSCEAQAQVYPLLTEAVQLLPSL